MSKNNNKIKAVILEKRGGATFCTPLLCMDVSISVLFLKFQIVGDCLMGTLRTDLSSGGSRISNIFSENSQHESFFLDRAHCGENYMSSWLFMVLRLLEFELVLGKNRCTSAAFFQCFNFASLEDSVWLFINHTRQSNSAIHWSWLWPQTESY